MSSKLLGLAGQADYFCVKFLLTFCLKDSFQLVVSRVAKSLAAKLCLNKHRMTRVFLLNRSWKDEWESVRPCLRNFAFYPSLDSEYEFSLSGLLFSVHRCFLLSDQLHFEASYFFENTAWQTFLRLWDFQCDFAADRFAHFPLFPIILQGKAYMRPIHFTFDYFR